MQQKVNPLYAGMTVIDGYSQPRSMNRNVKTYMREGYLNDTLYKCVNYAQINGAAIPPVLYTDKSQVGKSDGKRIEKHALLDKLDRPNNEWSGVFLRKSIIGHYLLTGNSFQYINRIAKSGPPDEIWTLPPDKVEPIPEQTRGITGYNYTEWAAEKNPIPPELIGHLRTWNPEDPFFGMSPVQVAAIIIDQQTDARKWNLSLLQNFGKLPGAWVTDALLSPNDRSKLEARVNEKFAGFRNAGKMPVLDGALKWQPSAVNPSELDWIESLKFNGGSIANIYNMPPPLIGDTSATTYDNMEQAEVISYTEFIFPTLDDLYSLWNMWLVPMYPDLANSGAYLYYDKESIEVIQKIIQAQKDAQADRAMKMWAGGLGTLNEMREKCGLQPLGSDGDVFRFGAVLVQKSALGDYAEQSLSTPAAPPPAQPEPLNVAGQPPINEGKPNASNSNTPVDSRPNNTDNNQQSNSTTDKSHWRALDLHNNYNTKALDLTTKEEKQAYAQSMETTRKKYETQYQRELASYFEQERKAVQQAISSSNAVGAMAGRAEGAINDQSTKLKKILLALYEDVATDVGGQISASLSGKKAATPNFSLLFGESQIKYLLSLAGTKVQQIDATTLDKLRTELAIGIDLHEGIETLAKRIDTLYLDQIIPNRSTTIAQTETHSAGSYAAIEVAKGSGMALNKVWMTTSSKPRPTHAAADGQEVGMDEKFIVGGVEMDAPGDPNGPAEEVINCYCVPYFRSAKVNDSDEKSIRRDEYHLYLEKVGLR
jgi:HK97 family phage portal protein